MTTCCTCPRCHSTHVNIIDAPRSSNRFVSGIYSAFILGFLCILASRSWGPTVAAIVAVLCVGSGIIGSILEYFEVWCKCNDCGRRSCQYSWQLPH